MKLTEKLRVVAVLVFALLVPSLASAQHYIETDLVTDIATPNVDHDPNLRNPWGLARSTGSPWWISDNNSGLNNTPGLATVYAISGAIGTPKTTLTATMNANLVVTIAPPKNSQAAATPTGMVFNGSTDFQIAPKIAASFIFATEDGTISGWSSAIDPNHLGNDDILVVDNSNSGAVYKGITTGDINGVRYLYVTNFNSGHVEVYDTNFKPVKLSHHDHDDADRDHDHVGDMDHDRHFEGAFDDDSIPHGFAPFNIQNIGGSIFVTYAKQNAEKHDDVAGPGNGYVDLYTTSGRLEARLQHGDWLNSPWGVVWAPRDFGEFSNRVLVGNFGSGQIAAFDGFTGKFIGLMKGYTDPVAQTGEFTVNIPGLWAIAFGNSGSAGPYNALFFTAGSNDESDGVFGALTAIAAEQDGDEE
jgi:uncharacterized protein (TIGR03118 family)